MRAATSQARSVSASRLSRRGSWFSAMWMATIAARLGHAETRNDQEEIDMMAEAAFGPAHVDPLTGLPGRGPFLEHLDRALDDARAARRPLAVLCIGLDRFRRVNDCLGYEVGDRVIVEAARRVGDCAAGAGDLARAGGDEFALLLRDWGTARDLRATADRILQALQAPFRIGMNEVRLAASVGIAISPAHGERAPDLLRGADAALGRVKCDGGRGFRFFAAPMGDEAVRRLALENGLARAWEAREFELHYQPIFDLRRRRVSGVEALMRWNHPLRGIVMAREFMEAADAMGLTGPMEDWAVEAACRQAAQWEREGLGCLDVAVNVSPRQFAGGALDVKVARALEASGLAAERLEIEITESAMLDPGTRTAQTLARLDALGVRLALDDFGTGYSNLACLRHVPLDRLKIDRAFVADLGRNAGTAHVLEAILAMARALGLLTVAEGVETSQQLAFLEAHGCDRVQGFLLSAAVAAEDLPAAIRRAESARVPEDSALSMPEQESRRQPSGGRLPSKPASSTALFTPIFSKMRAR